MAEIRFSRLVKPMDAADWARKMPIHVALSSTTSIRLEAVTDGTFKLIFPHKHATYEEYVPGNDGQPGNLTVKEIRKAVLYVVIRVSATT